MTQRLVIHSKSQFSMAGHDRRGRATHPPSTTESERGSLGRDRSEPNRYSITHWTGWIRSSAPGLYPPRRPTRACCAHATASSSERPHPIDQARCRGVQPRKEPLALLLRPLACTGQHQHDHFGLAASEGPTDSPRQDPRSGPQTRLKTMRTTVSVGRQNVRGQVTSFGQSRRGGRRIRTRAPSSTEEDPRPAHVECRRDQVRSSACTNEQIGSREGK
jgi:hypothetical protein